MTLDPLVLVLIGVILVLLVLIAYLFGKRGSSNNKSRQQDSPKTAPDLNAIKARLDAEKKRLDNSKSLEAIDQCVGQMGRLMSAGIVDRISGIVGQPYGEICEFTNKHEGDFPFAAVEQVINWVNVPKMRKHLDQQIDECFEEPTRGLLAEIDNHKRQHEVMKADQSSVSDDQIYNLCTQLSQVLRKDLQPVYAALSELQSMQAQLINMIPRAKDYIESSGNDVGTLAKYFGGGALSVVSPLIGIPALIAAASSDYKKGKQAEAFFEDFNKRYQALIDCWNGLAQTYREGISRQNDHLSARFGTLLRPLVLSTYRAMDKAGINLEQYASEWKQGIERLDHDPDS